jgi:uncharacterized protein YqhQ
MIKAIGNIGVAKVLALDHFTDHFRSRINMYKNEKNTRKYTIQFSLVWLVPSSIWGFFVFIVCPFLFCETRFRFIAQSGLKLEIFLPLPFE